MNILKKLAIATTVAMLGMTSAHAVTEINGTFHAETLPGDPGDPDLYWDISSSNPDYTDLAGQAKTKNDQFIDFFVFNVPDSEYITFFADAPRNGVSFNSFGLFVFADGTPIDQELTPVLPSIEGGTYLLTSGTYELDLFGTFTKQGGTFEGTINGAPVPEPANWALMLAGLAAMGSIARRRQNKA